MTTANGARAPDHDHLTWLERYADLGRAAFAGKSLLDLGCGSGFLCQVEAESGAREVVGVDVLDPDVKPVAWRFAKTDLDATGWETTLARPAGGGGFDVITAFDILEHLASPVRFLASCHALLAPGGRLILTTPNINSWERVARPGGWSGATDAQHRVLFSRYSLGFLVERCGFAAEVLKAPLRKLEFAGGMCPQIGAQIFCAARRV